MVNLLMASGLLAVAVSSAWSQPQGCGWGWGGGHMWPWGGFGILLWILLIILIIRLVAGPGRHRGPWGAMGREETALDILKKRYAKGEISKEEFDRMRKDIEG